MGILVGRLKLAASKLALGLGQQSAVWIGARLTASISELIIFMPTQLFDMPKSRQYYKGECWPPTI